MGLQIIKTITETIAKPKKAAKAFDEHKTWYNEAMPVELSAKHPELGRARAVGSPRDTAAEYAGAMDWAQRSPFGETTDSALAIIYQLLNNGLTKNARDNMQQDLAAIKAAKGKDYSQSDLLDIAAKYAKEHSYGTPATDVLPEEEDTPKTQLYAMGGLATAMPQQGAPSPSMNMLGGMPPQGTPSPAINMMSSMGGMPPQANAQPNPLASMGGMPQQPKNYTNPFGQYALNAAPGENLI
jgi:hypothetical protein